MNHPMELNDIDTGLIDVGKIKPTLEWVFLYLLLYL
jgi:hypothetical protein